MRVILILNVIMYLRNPLIVTSHIEILISLFYTRTQIHDTLTLSARGPSLYAII